MFILLLLSCSASNLHMIVRVDYLLISCASLAFSNFCKCQILQTTFLIMCPRNFTYPFLNQSSSILYISIYHVFSMLSPASFDRTISLLPEIASSSVKKLFRIYCHIGGLILHCNSALFILKKLEAMFWKNLVITYIFIFCSNKIDAVW